MLSLSGAGRAIWRIMVYWFGLHDGGKLADVLKDGSTGDRVAARIEDYESR